MPRFLIEYEVEEPDLNMATQLGFRIMYETGYKPVAMHVKPAEEHSGRAFGERTVVK